jgi:hypothetical protein
MGRLTLSVFGIGLISMVSSVAYADTPAILELQRLETQYGGHLGVMAKNMNSSPLPARSNCP